MDLGVVLGDGFDLVAGQTFNVAVVSFGGDVPTKLVNPGLGAGIDSGSVYIQSTSETSIKGTYDVLLTDGVRVTDSFDALVCGGFPQGCI